MSQPTEAARRSNRVMLVKLGIVVAVMFGFGFALVPFYDQICKATRIRGIDMPHEVTHTQGDLAPSVRLQVGSETHKIPWRVWPPPPHHAPQPGGGAPRLVEDST